MACVQNNNFIHAVDSVDKLFEKANAGIIKNKKRQHWIIVLTYLTEYRVEDTNK